MSPPVACQKDLLLPSPNLRLGVKRVCRLGATTISRNGLLPAIARTIIKCQWAGPIWRYWHIGMTIEFDCPSCRKTYKVRDELAGKKATCSACKKPLVVPPASAHHDGAI